MRQNKKKSNFHLSVITITLLCCLLIQSCGSTTENAPAIIQDNSFDTIPDNTEETNVASIPDASSAEAETTNAFSDADTRISQPAENAPLQPKAECLSEMTTIHLAEIVPENTSVSPSVTGALRVNGSKLTDSSGNIIQLRGLSTHGIAWFPDYINEACFHQLKEEWNINVIRLAMYTAEYNGYCTGGDQAYLKELVKNGVEYATASDLYVIIDWHILSDGNPHTYKEQAKSFFAEMATLYADYDNVLYEICNEPNGAANWNDIKSYAEEIIPVIRSYDKDGIIIVGTPNWSQYVDQAVANPITGYDNIMYALHFYAATHTDALRNTMVSAADAGLPIFVSEYGICDASGNGAIDEYQAGQWTALMDEYDISYVAWNLSNKNETSAILSSDCNKTSGFSENDLSSSGKWLYAMLTDSKTGSSAP